MNNLVEAALSYATKGYLVFPCKPKSKRPATPNGFKDATTDTETIRRWWTENPDYNVAIKTGVQSGLLVIDVDGEDGQNTLAEWREKGRQLPYTAWVETAHGGHVYVRHPGQRVGNSVKRVPGIDVREEGGYVLAPPSVHPDTGAPYRWKYGLKRAGVAECPSWLLHELTRRSERLTAPVERTIPEGSRNSTLFSRARSLFAQGYNDVVVRAAINALNRSACIPPLPDDEAFKIVESAGSENYERGQLSPSSSPRSSDSDDALPEVRMFRDMTPPAGPRPYIIDGVIFQGFAGAIYGDGGSAKSMLVMHMGQAVARGDDWLGFETVKTDVLYLDFELDEDEQSRRAYQVAAGMGYAEPPEGFFYLSGAGYPTRPMFEHALNICREHNIGMAIVDSLGYALEGDAEASRDVLKFFREVEGTFRREGISLFIVDHQAKQQSGTRYQDKTMFGSVYKTNSIRSVFQVEPSNHEDGSLSVIVRHKKANFGPLLKPFGVQVTFDTNTVKVDTRELDSTELAQERRLNATERVALVLENGPTYPEDIAEATGLELGTVKNALTALRKAGEVKPTGNKRDGRGSEEVTLTELSSLSSPLSDGDGDGELVALAS